MNFNEREVKWIHSLFIHIAYSSFITYIHSPFVLSVPLTQSLSLLLFRHLIHCASSLFRHPFHSVYTAFRHLPYVALTIAFHSSLRSQFRQHQRALSSIQYIHYTPDSLHSCPRFIQYFHFVLSPSLLAFVLFSFTLCSIRSIKHTPRNPFVNSHSLTLH